MNKILFFSDIHTNQKDSSELYAMKKAIDIAKPDIVVIGGDIFESSVKFNPYEELSKLGKPVVFCLGNHEFAYRSVEDTLKFYRDSYDPSKWDVHCLDIVEKWEKDDINIIGNVLWYDGSFKDVSWQPDNIIVDGWLDKTIKKFNFREECIKNQEMIFKNFNSDKKNILLTHTCPDEHLNTFKKEGPSPYNFYSGMNLLEKLEDKKMMLHLALCGHTHRYESMMVHGVLCVNLGNDYFFKTKDMKNMMFII